MVEAGADDSAILQAIRLAPRIFAPRHFIRVLLKVATADPMMHAVLGAPEAAKEARLFSGLAALAGAIGVALST